MNKKENVRLQGELTLAHSNFEHGLNARASFKIQDTATCEDLVQTTFMKTWLYLVRGGKIDIMEAFLYHVLNGLIIDEYRKHKSTSLDVLLEKGFEPSTNGPEQMFNVLDGKAAVLLMQRLPKKYQKIMRMRYVQDLSLEEMSLITGQSKNTMAVQAHRGLGMLRELYGRNTKV